MAMGRKHTGWPANPAPRVHPDNGGLRALLGDFAAGFFWVVVLALILGVALRGLFYFASFVRVL